MRSPLLSIAIPKGRLFNTVLEYFASLGMKISFGSGKLSAVDSSGRLEVYKVKNHDLPTYLHYGIAGLGIIGDDTVAESGLTFTRVLTLPFGSTKLCVAAKTGTVPPELLGETVVIATSYVRITREWFHHRGIPVKIIRLGGSVELAPALGLAPYISDLVETGNTLKANGLTVLSTLSEIEVRLIANPAYFKLHYREIQKLVDNMAKGSS